MQFGDLFTSFVSGTPIKRADWDAMYWRYNRGVIEIHDGGDVAKDFLLTEDVLYTVSQFTQSDWEIATADNVSIPIVEPDTPPSQNQDMIL